jgi:hypothetical protein
LLTLNFNEGADMKKLFILLAAMLTFTSTAFAEIGSIDKDLVYTPVTPCRIFDTRVSQGGTGPIAAAGTKSFLIWGQTSYAGQGGAASNCGITALADTAAVAVNFTVVSPATPGFITAFPFGTTRPTAATVNFNAGDVRGNFSIAKNAQGGASDLSVFSTSNVEVVADVVGYYSKPVATALNCVTVAGTGLSVGANAYSNIPIASCAAGFTPVGVDFSAGARVVKADSGFSYLYVLNLNTVAQTVTPQTRCCQIPGR